MSLFYTLNHLLISKSEYNALPAIQRSPKELNIKEIEPDAKTVRYWVEQVGGPYGWPDREQYTLEAIEELIKTPETRLFMLLKDGCPLGYCLTHKETARDLRSHFMKAGHNIPDDAKITRIEGFGLAYNQTDRDYGDLYLNEMYKILFDDAGKDYVYLTSRNTNHSGVIPFYLDNGMSVIDTETKPEDRPAHLILMQNHYT